MRLSPPCEMRTIPLHYVQSNSMVAIKHERSFDLLDAMPDSPQENSHMSRGTLRSPQQHKRVSCSTNQTKTRLDYPALAQEPSCIHHQT